MLIEGEYKHQMGVACVNAKNSWIRCLFIYNRYLLYSLELYSRL
jgi:hypothetical protein